MCGLHISGAGDFGCIVTAMKVAVAQFSAGMDKAANLQCIAEHAGHAAGAGAELVVFPEGSMCDFGVPTHDLRGLAEPLDGTFVEGVRRLATGLRVTIVAGMFETIAGDQRIYNTAVVVGPEGEVAAAYRKRNLFDAFGDRESARFRSGDGDLPLLELHGFEVALAICYDVRFPGFISAAADRGAELLMLPSAWVAGPLKEDHWNVMVRARAMENTMYVAAAGQTGAKYCGRSMVVDPLGVVIAGLGEAEGVAVAELSKDRLRAVRARLPLLAQRRAATPGTPSTVA